MSGHGVGLDAEHVRGLFRELSDRLAAAEVRAQLFVVGGRRWCWPTTRTVLPGDVDALFVRASEVREAAEAIGTTHGPEPDRLNVGGPPCA